MLSRATLKPRPGAYLILIQHSQRSFAHNPAATDDLTLVPEPRRSGVQASFKKGTQGRSSFSGIVATVFGASGFLGCHVVNRLGKVGSQLIIPYRGDPYHARHLKLAGDLGQVLFTHFLLKDEQSVRKAMMYSNTVINLMGNLFPTRNYSFDDLYVEGARRVARLARECGVRKLIHVSQLNASLEPEPHLIMGGSKVLRAKALGELAVREEFPEAVIIRPSSLFGMEDRFTNVLLNPFFHFGANKPELYRAGEYTFKQPIYVGDVARAIYECVHDPTTNGKTFELVGPYCYKLSELVEWLYTYANRTKETGAHFRRSNITAKKIFFTNIWEAWAWIRKYQVEWNWEWVEQTECHSDVLTGASTIEDLGIHDLVQLEHKVGSWIQMYNRIASYYPDVGEFPIPPFPTHYPPLRKPAIQMGGDESEFVVAKKKRGKYDAGMSQRIEMV